MRILFECKIVIFFFALGASKNLLIDEMFLLSTYSMYDGHVLFYNLNITLLMLFSESFK